MKALVLGISGLATDGSPEPLGIELPDSNLVRDHVHISPTSIERPRRRRLGLPTDWAMSGGEILVILVVIAYIFGSRRDPSMVGGAVRLRRPCGFADTGSGPNSVDSR
jgi:hypothetical protein